MHMAIFEISRFLSIVTLPASARLCCCTAARRRYALDVLPKPMFTTRSGILYEGDCLSIMPSLESESVDLVFADPPFNLGKSYSSRIDDALGERQYLDWSKRW